MKPVFIIVAAALLTGGCASSASRSLPRPGSNLVQPPVGPVGAGVVEMYPTPSQARPATANPKFTVPAAPAAVWRQEEIEEVYYDAYINEKGEAFRPGSKFVVRRPGGWNIEALRNPGGAYIPGENVGQVAGDPGMTYTPLVSPGTGVKPAEEAIPVSDLVDVSQMKITGIFGKNREALAKAQCGPGEVTVEHPQLGWVIIPATAVHDNLGLPAAKDNQ